MNQLPSNNPLPLLLPLQPPLKVISIFQKYKQKDEIPSKKVEIHLKSPKKDDYKHLYQQKCEELTMSIKKCKSLQLLLEQLRQENKELQIQIKRMQEDKWQKCSTFRQSQNRKRSKSTKKMTPTIEVKVPNSLEKERESSSERIKVLDQEIEVYKKQIVKLNQQLKVLKQKQSDSKQSTFSNNREKMQTHSPPNFSQNYPDFQKKKYPHTSQFSPNDDHSFTTVKKDKDYRQDFQFEIKRLKNELLYKELLLDKLKEESIKENSFLQTHLKLSVEESRKMAETTSEVMNLFKKEIIQLWKQLQQEKNKNSLLEEQLRGKNNFESEVKFKWNPSGDVPNQPNLVSLLQVRRNQKIQ